MSEAIRIGRTSPLMKQATERPGLTFGSEANSIRFWERDVRLQTCHDYCHDYGQRVAEVSLVAFFPAR